MHQTYVAIFWILKDTSNLLLVVCFGHIGADISFSFAEHDKTETSVQKSHLSSDTRPFSLDQANGLHIFFNHLWTVQQAVKHNTDTLSHYKAVMDSMSANWCPFTRPLDAEHYI